MRARRRATTFSSVGSARAGTRLWGPYAPMAPVAIASHELSTRDMRMMYVRPGAAIACALARQAS